jgi:hypothetical protein
VHKGLLRYIISYFFPKPKYYFNEREKRAAKKGEKERKDKEKKKKSGKMTEQEQYFIKLWETWEKMQASGDIIQYFFL